MYACTINWFITIFEPMMTKKKANSQKYLLINISFVSKSRCAWVRLESSLKPL